MAEPAPSAPGQLWYISYPGGEVHRVTNDLTNYGLSSLGITLDAKTIAAVQTAVHEELWVAPAGNSDHATQIAFNGEPRRINFAGSNRLIISDQHGQPLAMHLDGSGQAALFPGRQILSLLDCGPSGALIFSETRDDAANVWKADADGGNPVQLTHLSQGKRALYPNCSPDGKSFVFWQAPNLLLQDINASSPPLKLDILTAAGGTRFSPDGKTIATLGFVAGPPERMAFEFGPAGEGKPRYLFDNVPASAAWFDWSPDGKAIDYSLLRRGAANVWRQPIEGGPYQQITKFTTPVMTGFRWSPDGKYLYVVRGTRSADIILLRDTK
jgi:hypothetical protein